MQAHTLGEVGILGTVLLRIYSGTILPIFIEISLYLTDKEQNRGLLCWHSFLRHGVCWLNGSKSQFSAVCGSHELNTYTFSCVVTLTYTPDSQFLSYRCLLFAVLFVLCAYAFVMCPMSIKDLSNMMMMMMMMIRFSCCLTQFGSLKDPAFCLNSN